MKYWRLFFAITVLALVGAGVWGWDYIHRPGVVPIKKVSVVGSRLLVHASRIQDAVLPFIMGGFFNVDVEGGQQALAKIPGIKSATIRRIWPNQIQIVIDEYTAIARWQNDGWLSPEGQVFYTDTPPQVDQNLPQFSAFKEDIPLILLLYPQLNAKLSPYDLHVKTMLRLGDNAWRLEISKGFDLKLKLDDLKPLEEFLSVYQQLLEDNPKRVLGSIDLRYPTGFSVKWLGN